MKKFIIYWDAGYGRTYEVTEAEDIKKADKQAARAWLEEAESNADYGSEEWTDARERELEENGEI